MRRWLRNVLITVLLVFPAVVVSLSYLEDVAESSGAGGIIPLLMNVPNSALKLASQTGYAGVFFLMLLEAAALPIPSEIILPFAGYLVYRGTLEFWPVIALATVAALFGSFADYYLGLRLGRALLTHKSRIAFFDGRRIGKSEAWFNQYGSVAVAALRLVPGARVLISFPAGIYRMNRLKFGVYTLAGCLPWNIVLTYLGWWLGSSWEAVVEAFRYINLVAYALLVLLVIWIGWRWTSRGVRRSFLRESH